MNTSSKPQTATTTPLQRPDATSLSRSPNPSRNLILPSLVSKSDILAAIDSELDFDQASDDHNHHPGYAECTCVSYKSPTPPPLLSDCASSHGFSCRPLPPPPPPPPPPHKPPSAQSNDGDDDDALRFPNSFSSNGCDNLEANLAPRSQAQRHAQQYQQLRKVLNVDQEGKICDASPKSVNAGNLQRQPNASPLNEPKNAREHEQHEKIENPTLTSSPVGRLKTILRSGEFPRKHNFAVEPEAKAGQKEVYHSTSVSPPTTSSESGSKKKTSKTRNGSGILKNKHPTDPSKVRISLFYTWSFSGQHRRRPQLLPISAPPQSVLAGPLPLTVHRCRSYPYRQPISHCPPPPPAALLTMPRDYHSGKKSRSTFSTAPRHRQNGTVSYSSRTLRPSQHCQPTAYSCYSTISDTPNVYRNIFPYTTLYRPTPAYQQYQQQPYQTLSPPAYYGQYTGQQSATTAAQLARSIRRQHRYPVNGSAQPAASEPGGTRTGFDVYVTDTPYHPYSTMSPGTIFGTVNAPTSSAVAPWTGVMDCANPTVTVEKSAQRTSTVGDSESILERERCSSRACLIGWMLALTAVIILALAIGLFVQISHESTRFDQLQRRPEDQVGGTTRTWGGNERVS